MSRWEIKAFLSRKPGFSRSFGGGGRGDLLEFLLGKRDEAHSGALKLDVERLVAMNLKLAIAAPKWET
jgi:hypothetical protein